MSKEQLPKELVERFEPLVMEIGLLPSIAKKCAKICLKKMEEEAIYFASWICNESTHFDMLNDKPLDISNLYRIFKTQTESKNK